MSRLPRLVVWCVVLLAVVLISQRPRIEAQQAPTPPVKIDDGAPAQTPPVPQGILVPQGQKWSTTMSPNQEVPPTVAPTARGIGWVVLNAAETQITVFMLYGGLTSNATLAHIHGDANSTPGVNGPIIFDLGVTGGTAGGNVNSTFAITPAQVALLRGHRLYINVHSVNFPAGEIRGQLHLVDAAANADFDGMTDASVFRPSDRVWYVLNSNNNVMSVAQWGAATDLFVPGDYDGDGRLDVAIFRPTIGVWFIRSSQTGSMIVHLWGASQDIPVPADYDKDGRTDPAVFRPATGQWYVLRSTAGPIGFPFGAMGDRPLAGDFDGDGRADIAVQTPGGSWNVLTAAGGLLTYPLNHGDTPLVPGDYTGDGRTDVGQFDPATGIWRFMDGSNSSPFLHIWGGPGDLPVPGDYDSDGRVDLGVFRPSDGRWYLRLSLTETLAIFTWGASEDIPLPSMFTMPSVVPTATGDTATVDEDSSATAIDVLANDTDPDGGPKRIFEVTPPIYGAAAITGNGTGLTYQPNPDYCGPDTFTYTLLPGGFTATVMVTVTCIDDAPVAVNDNASVNEDSAATPINVLANDTDIDGGPMTINQVTQPANGTVVITGGGTGLTYQPNADYCNAPGPTDNFTYTLAPGTSTATVAVTVVCVNDAPVATDDTLSSVAEDSAPRVISWGSLLANDSPGPPSEAGQTLIISAVSNPVGGTVSLIAAAVIFTPTANYNGPASFDYTLQDNGAPPLTDTGSVTFTITEVNDAPVATDDPLSSVLEDSAPRSISLVSLISNDTVGPPNEEASQSLTVTGVSNSVGGTAVLSGANVMFTLTPNFFGTASFDYTIQDNGTTNGAPDALTDVGMASFTVTAVNDAPSFLIPANPPPVNEDAGPQTITNFATSISAGPNENGQVLTFVIVSNSNPTLFSTGPSISSTGTLNYTSAPNQNGVANIQVRLDDDGGTANGGDNQSDPISFSITVNAVNDAPVASNKIGSAQANMLVSIPNLLVGVTDADTGVNGCTPTFTLASAGPTTSPLGGSVAITNAATGTVDFNPPPGATGLVTFTYTVSDNGCPGTATSAAATVSVTVNGPVIWFVNSAAPAGGDGRLTTPFNTLAGADAVDAASHRIFLYTGTYTTGLTMQATEWLIGQGATGASFDALMGITPPAGTIARPTINGTRPTIAVGAGTAVTLNSGNTVRGLNVTNTNGSGITGSAVGTLALGDFDVTTTNGPALSLTTSGTVTATGTDNDLNSTNSTALHVNAVTIGGAGLTFKSIAAGAGANNGINLVNSGAGGLTVTGSDGGDVGADPDLGSGGTINGKTGADGSTTAGTGVFLSNANNISLNGMVITNHQNYGIRGNEVDGFRLTFSLVGGVNGTNVASPFSEGSVSFIGTPTTGYGLRGAVAILDNEITGGMQRNVSIDNPTGTMNFNFLRNNVHHTNPSFGDDGLAVEVDTTAVLFANVSNNTFTAHGGDHFNLSLINNANADLTFKNNDMQGGHATGLGQGVLVFGASYNGTLKYDISNNGTLADPFIGNRQGGAIHVNKGSGTGTFSGQITNNVIGDPAIPLSGSLEAFGIVASARGAGGSHTTLISGNTVREFNDRGILMQAGEGSPTFTATVTNNTVSDFGSAVNSLHGIHLDFGILAADNAQITIDVRNNLIANAGNEAQGGSDFRMRTAGMNDTFIAGYSGGNSSANAQAFIDGQNPDGTSFNVTQAASGTYNNGPASPLPPPNLPTLPPAPRPAIEATGARLDAPGPSGR